jgi:hypothetical protein
MGVIIVKKPNDTVAWGWYNFGILLGVEYRRKAAIAAVENHTGAPWKEAKKYMQVMKVVVSAL